MYVSEMDPQIEHSVTLAAKRQVYMVCIEGSVNINDTLLESRDAAEIVGHEHQGLDLLIKSGPTSSHIMLIEMDSPVSIR